MAYLKQRIAFTCKEFSFFKLRLLIYHKKYFVVKIIMIYFWNAGRSYDVLRILICSITLNYSNFIRFKQNPSYVEHHLSIVDRYCQWCIGKYFLWYTFRSISILQISIKLSLSLFNVAAKSKYKKNRCVFLETDVLPQIVYPMSCMFFTYKHKQEKSVLGVRRYEYDINNRYGKRERHFQPCRDSI